MPISGWWQGWCFRRPWADFGAANGPKKSTPVLPQFYPGSTRFLPAILGLSGGLDPVEKSLPCPGPQIPRHRRTQRRTIRNRRLARIAQNL